MQYWSTPAAPRRNRGRRPRLRVTRAPRLAVLFGVAIICLANAGGQGAAGAGPPTAATPPTAAVGNWSVWTPAPNLSFLSPSLAVNPAAGGLELATVGLDLAV